MDKKDKIIGIESVEFVNFEASIKEIKETITNGDQLKMSVLAQYREFCLTFISNLNLSILAGEYHLLGIDENIKEFRGSIEIIAKKITEENEIEESEKTKFITVLFLLVETYKDLSEFVKINADYTDSNIYLKYSLNELVNFDKIVFEIKDYFFLKKYFKKDSLILYEKVFRLNVKIAEIDDSLTCNLNDLKNIDLIINELSGNETKNDPIISVLIEKCKFFSFKIRKRLNKDKIKLGIGEKSIIGKDEFVYYKDFYTYFKNYYINYGEDDIFDQEELLIINNNVKEKIDIRCLHIYSKYFRKHACSIEDYKKYYKILHRKLTEIIESDGHNDQNFNKDSHKAATINLLTNELEADIAIFKKKFEENNLDNDESLISYKKGISKIESFYKKITEFETEKKFLSFIPHKTICKFYYGILENIKTIESDKKGKTISIIIEIAKKFNIEIRKLKESIEWSKKYNMLPYYMPFNDCIVKVQNIENQEIELFLDSTYILPIDYEEVYKEVEEFVLFTNEILTDQIFEFTVLKIENKISDFKQDIKNIEDIYNIKQNEQTATFIQLLGVFAAIITFVLGSISVVPKLHDVYNIIIFMIAFAISLILFIISIVFITKKKDVSKVIENKEDENNKGCNKIFGLCKYTHIAVLILILILITILFLFKSPKIDENESGSNNNKIKIENNVIKSNSLIQVKDSL